MSVMSPRNQVVWTDVFVTDLDRAMKFYSAVLGNEVSKVETPGFSFAVLPMEQGGTGGCLVPDPGEKPCANGPLVYFNVNGRLDDAIAKVESNGGKILMARHDISPHGFRAIVLDSEGNRIALHSM